MEQSNEAAPKIICDGKLEIIKLTEQYHEEAVGIFMENFIKNENFCTITNLLANPNAVKEIEILFREVLKDGISFAAKDTESGRLAGLCVNKILAPNSTLNLDEIFKTFKTREMLFIGDCLDQLDRSFDMYAEFNIDCSMEIVFLSTRPEYERKGIARSLSLYAMAFAKDLGNGLLPDEDFPKHIQGRRPKAVCSVFTSKFTQIIGQKLGFDTVGRILFKEMEYNGYKASEKLNPLHECVTIAVKRL